MFLETLPFNLPTIRIINQTVSRRLNPALRNVFRSQDGHEGGENQKSSSCDATRDLIDIYGYI